MSRYEEEQLHIEKLLDEFDEIPSDPESVDDEEDDDDDNVDDIIGDYVIGQDNILESVDEYSNIYSDNDDANDCGKIDNNIIANYQTVNNDLDFEDEDDKPLSVLLYELGVFWSSNYPTGYNNINNQCRQATGPKLEATEPLDVFFCLFSKELIEDLVFQTNLYHTQVCGGASRTPTNKEEMEVFLGINILMGIKKLPYYRDHWSSCFEMRDPYISSAMSVNRFGWFLSNLHCNDNSKMLARDAQDYDKLYKIRPLLDKLSETYKTCYDPTHSQAIDESMIPFKGRSSLKQYMPDKPTKRGYKVWVRADSFGYVIQFQIYEGKRKNITEKHLGFRVVKELTSDLIEKYYTIYFDNFFSSVDLMIYLQKTRINAAGTTRSNRKNFPRDFSDDKHMNRGDSEWRSTKTAILSVKWKDRKGIYFLSNFHNPTQKTFVNRKQHDGSSQRIECPLLIRDYNANMGYVDKADMLKSVYAINRKSRKWWHRIFFHMLDTTIVDAFVIFSQLSEGKVMSLKEFRFAIAVGLIGVSHKENDQ